jgi:hypothetical protein
MSMVLNHSFFNRKENVKQISSSHNLGINLQDQRQATAT